MLRCGITSDGCGMTVNSSLPKTGQRIATFSSDSEAQITIPLSYVSFSKISIYVLLIISQFLINLVGKRPSGDRT